MKGFYITITNNLLDPKHCLGIKESIWLFMWLIDKITSISEEGIGKVLGGKPIKFEEVRDELGISKNTYGRWVAKLVKNGYINIKQAPYGTIFSVNKAKKRFGRRVPTNGESISPRIGKLECRNGESNKTVQLDSTVYNTRNIKNIKRFNDLKAKTTIKSL